MEDDKVVDNNETLENSKAEEVSDKENAKPSKDSKENKKSDSKSKKTGFMAKFKEVKSEFKKVIWTPKNEIFKQTGTVIVVSIMVGIIIVIIDSIFHFGYSELYKLIVG